MVTRLLHHIRNNVIAYLALFVALGAGGGYAMAASKTKTVTVCADKTTGVLHLKTHGRCKRGQTRVIWNQQGPEGPQGLVGQPGTPAVSVWANVSQAGVVISGQGISVQHIGLGTYQVTITAPACAQARNAPVVTVADANPPSGHTAGAFPIAWYGTTGVNDQFPLFTGDVVGGSFAASDHSFTVMDTCM
jgi:hypothetical protein